MKFTVLSQFAKPSSIEPRELRIRHGFNDKTVLNTVLKHGIKPGTTVSNPVPLCLTRYVPVRPVVVSRLPPVVSR